MSFGSSKADLELKLDECITSALESLLKNYPASEEFMSIFQEVSSLFCFLLPTFYLNFSFSLYKYLQKMFIKSNTKAFIHVTHYLFTVLDEKEVKKRFYWPIKCKTDENHFR